MDDQPTCGKGLAGQSALPEHLARLCEAMAVVLEVHMKALDILNEDAKREYDAYNDVATAHRRLAVELHSVAQCMKGFRDLPEAPHDMAAMMGPEPLEAFRQYVMVEEELHVELHRRLETDRQMLGEMSVAVDQGTG